MARPLRILHVLRAPIGGLFRHVCDLARAQAQAGFEVGLICDASTGGMNAERALCDLEPICALGINRVEMSRQIGLRDISAGRRVRNLANLFEVDVLHGHGAKGGAFARLARSKKLGRKAFYTPHGGSLHYNWRSLHGVVYLGLEKLLVRATDGLVFESQYAQSAWVTKLGALTCPNRVIPNGLGPSDFEPVTLEPSAYNFLYIGELRDLKGVDVLLNAVANLNKTRTVRCLIVGDGPDAASLHDLAVQLNLTGLVDFAGVLPAREAFTKGRHLVVPSRAESFPYIVLEAAAAAKPITATRVGGIPEIFADQADQLIEADNVAALTQALEAALEHPKEAERTAHALNKYVAANFTIERMSRDISDFYQNQTSGSPSKIAANPATPSPAREHS